MKRHSHNVRLLRAAEQDLTEAVMYVMAESPAAARALAERMEKQLALLSGQPLMGKTPGDAKLAGMGYRYIVVKNYLVFYTVEENDVLVHLIIHGARDYLNILQ